MSDIKNLARSAWECGYHVVWIPECRRKQLYGGVAKYPGSLFHEPARERESRISEGHLCPDHAHALIGIPPEYSVAQVIGYIKGKSAIAISRRFVGERKKLHGTELLGGRVLCVNGGSGRSDHQEVYPGTGSGRQTA